jgi:hypothetical protein
LTRCLGPEAVASGTIEAEVSELIRSPTLDDFKIDTLFGNDNALFYDFLDPGNGWTGTSRHGKTMMHLDRYNL